MNTGMLVGNEPKVIVVDEGMIPNGAVVVGPNRLSCVGLLLTALANEPFRTVACFVTASLHRLASFPMTSWPSILVCPAFISRHVILMHYNDGARHRVRSPNFDNHQLKFLWIVTLT